METMAGRGPVLELLMGGLASTLRGHGRGYGLSGPSGIGKTHLLKVLERTADELGFTILRGNGNPEGTAAEVFSSLLPRPPPASADPALPMLLRERMTSLTKRGPVLLTLEDMHWADGGTVSLLVLLARAVVEQRGMIVLTFDSEWIDSHYGEVSPLVDGLRILSRERAYDEIAIGPLDRPTLVRAVEEDLEAPLDLPVADFIWDRSEGNPLVAKETARLLVQTKQVENRRGRWTATGKLELGESDDYSYLVRRRLEMLTPDDRTTLEVAAVIGRTFDPRVVALVQQRDLLDVLEQMDRIAHDHRMVEEDSELYRFSGALVWRVLLEDLPPGAERDLHGRIGKVLERGLGGGTNLGDLSEHYYQAGSKEKCVCFSLLAGQGSLEEGKFPEAKEHFQKVLDATDGGGYEVERRFCREGMADAELGLGAVDSARSLYSGLLQSAASEEERARIQAKMTRILTNS